LISIPVSFVPKIPVMISRRHLELEWNGIVQGVLDDIPRMIDYLMKQNIRVWFNA